MKVCRMTAEERDATVTLSCQVSLCLSTLLALAAADSPHAAPTHRLYQAAPVYQTTPVYRAAPVYQTTLVYRAAPVYRAATVYRAAPVYQTTLV